MKAIFIQLVADKADTAEQPNALLALRDSVAAYETPMPVLLSASAPARSSAAKHRLGFHPDDLAIGTTMLNKLETMATGMTVFLLRFPVNAEAEERE